MLHEHEIQGPTYFVEEDSHLGTFHGPNRGTSFELRAEYDARILCISIEPLSRHTYNQEFSDWSIRDISCQMAQSSTFLIKNHACFGGESETTLPMLG